MKPRVLITGTVPKKWLGELADLTSVTIWKDDSIFFMPREQLLKQIGSFDAVLNFTDVKTDDELLKRATKLKIIANCAIGFDNLDLPLLTSYGIWASNAPGFFSYPVSEYVLTGILAISRRLLEADNFVRKGLWKSFQPGRWDGMSLKEKVVGIVGLGATGKQLRRLVTGLGAKVIYHSPSPKKEAGWVPLETLVTTADIISIHVPLNAATSNLFSASIFRKMKQGVIIANTSRGGVMDEDALVQGLQSGKISGAVLDVFQQEPMVPEALLTMKNVLLTPHIAGGTRFSREASLRRAAQNIISVLNGNKPLNPLNNVPL